MKKILLLFMGILCSLGMWANYSSTTANSKTTLSWDFGEYTTEIKSSTDVNSVIYQGLECVFGTTDGKDVIKNSVGFKCNGSSSSTRRYIKYTPEYNGTIKVTAKGNGTSGTRITYIGKNFNIDEALNNVVSTEDNTIYTRSFEEDLDAGTTYYIYFGGGGQAITKIEYTYISSSTATPSFTTNLNATYNAIVGKKTTLTVAASDVTGYKWYKCDDAGKTNPQVISGANSASYDFTPSLTGDYYLYCEATNDNATSTKTVASNVAKVTAEESSSFVITWQNINGWGIRVNTSGAKSGDEFDKNSTISLTADLGASYHFVHWTVNDEPVSTENNYTHTVTGAATIKAVYEANKKLIFDGTNQEAYADKDGEITVPQNWYHYEAGKTVNYWTGSDGNTYKPGDVKTLTEDVTLTPNYVTNKKELAYGATVTWSFAFPNSCPLFNSIQGAGAVRNYVQQANINGKNIDINMICDATSGKIDNARRMSNDLTQVNNGTKFTLPAVKGMTVKISANANMSTTTIAGSTSYTGSGTKNISYTYEGTDETIDIVINDGSYLSSIVVTYPKTEDDPVSPTVIFSMKTAATGNVSIDAGASKAALPANANLTISDGSSVTVSNGQSDAKNLVTSAGFAMTNGNTFFTVTLANDNVLQIGDVITATMSQTGRGLKFSTNDAYSNDYPGDAAATTSFTYTVTKDDGICGASTFNVMRATGNSTYFNNFKITRPYSTVVTLGTNGYSTFATTFPCKAAGATAYYGTVNNEGATVRMNEISADATIPENEGIVLKGNEGDKVVMIYSADDAADLSDNALVGVTTETTAFETTGTNYVLASNGTQTAFVQMADDKTVASMVGKAYLNVPSGAKMLSIIFGDEETTAADEVTEAKAAAGKLVNLAGQAVGAGFKGIVIDENGNKFMK